MNAPFSHRRPHCPYCAETVHSWHQGAWIEPCDRCKRPIVLLRSPLDWNGPLRMRGLLDVASTAYGFATVVLVVTFVISDMSAITFAKALTLLLFVIGSILCVDGGLGLRSRIDRTWKALRFGRVAVWFSAAKIACGVTAMLLVTVGLGL